jgi:hypothetical protein
LAIATTEDRRKEAVMDWGASWPTSQGRAIAELARVGMAKDFRNFDPAAAEIILVQSGPRLLPAFPESLSEVARRSLVDMGVNVLLSAGRIRGADISARVGTAGDPTNTGPIERVICWCGVRFMTS